MRGSQEAVGALHEVSAAHHAPHFLLCLGTPKAHLCSETADSAASVCCPRVGVSCLVTIHKFLEQRQWSKS